MNRKDCRNALMQLLQRQSQCIVRANDYLDDVKLAFVDNRLQGMQELLQSPRFDFSEIESLEQERRQLLGESGFDGDNRGIADCIEWCDDADHQLTTHYLELIEKLKTLQLSIQVNSLLISKGRDRVRRSIGVLTGVTAADVKTYSSSGQAVNAAHRRNLAIA